MAAVLLETGGAGAEVVRRVLACAVLRAGRCDPAVAGELASRVRLAWDPEIPEEVALTAAGPLRWYLDPQVLLDGLHAPAREGGVFIAPLPAPVPCPTTGATAGMGSELRHDIVLDPGHDRVALQVRTRELAGFLEAMQQAAGAPWGAR